MASEENTIEPSDSGFDTKSRPASALLAGMKFLMNLEETHHFFTIFDSVDGKQNEHNYQRYLTTEAGRKMDREDVNFAEVLSDREYLESFSPGSLADDYLSFLKNENLSLDLLMNAENEAESSALNVDKSRRNYTANGIATHDLLHVVTGYKRDPVGEACLLAFTAEQFDLGGIGAFAHALALREQIRSPKSRIMAMIKEAKKRARDCIWVAEVDWRDELGRPTDEVRSRMKLSPSIIYSNKNINRKKALSKSDKIRQTAA